MDNVYKISNFLLPTEIAEINNVLTNKNLWALRSEKKEDPGLGRVMYTLQLSNNIHNDVKERAEKLLGRTLPPMSFMFAHYEAKYGQPNLAPHFDGDNNSIIIDYQYRSNTPWALGLDTEVFEMQDNDALIFNPNEYPHWRPHKLFKEGEFVTMIFFRFPDQTGQTDYSHMNLMQDDPIFDKARQVRDSLARAEDLL